MVDNIAGSCQAARRGRSVLACAVDIDDLRAPHRDNIAFQRTRSDERGETGREEKRGERRIEREGSVSIKLILNLQVPREIMHFKAIGVK